MCVNYRLSSSEKTYQTHPLFEVFRRDDRTRFFNVAADNKQDADTTEPDIRPRVSCPNDGHLMYLAEVRPERKSFRLWKCPECNTIRTNEELSDAATSSS